ncbi:hypothetical protein H6G89_11570 [Oscillatoria sp. FACHB-1407]|uniref:hypothetical protein n=1 Tax=Oscillatoria sp. FACHB-1407 TaxID=2692847 RepID=UPI0016881DA9|nr:hypothetical protein [Oscillatoria sp. FACHB-1407]MBD2461690.1 hypothetical protein [Oscillatoria sp. FACHB-1407]
MNSFQHDLRYLVQGMVVTLVVCGTIATFAGASYLVLLLLIANRGSLFEALKIPGLELWLILGTMIQIPVWIALTRIRFVARSLGWAIAGMMTLILVFSFISSFLLPG